MPMQRSCDVAIVGGGLAGMVAAHRLQSAGHRPTLIDKPVLAQHSQLGGFAQFSGAKFSLFPAGTGLTQIAGGNASLIKYYNDVLRLLSLSKVPAFDLDFDKYHRQVKKFDQGLQLRDYHSIVLSPIQMEHLIAFLQSCLTKTDIITSSVRKICRLPAGSFSIQLENGQTVFSSILIMASGRTGASLLTEMQVAELPGKGIDLGVRLEFDDPSLMRGLVDLGPDAKIIANSTRTFCMNAPGHIFHYPFHQYLIPGGVVASPEVRTCNIGILWRNREKVSHLSRMLSAYPNVTAGDPLFLHTRQLGFLNETQIQAVLGSETLAHVATFIEHLELSKLLSLAQPYKVHFPLIDWHWPVFAQSGGFETSIPNLFVIGDLSGHARGLLQAATCGWIVADHICK